MLDKKREEDNYVYRCRDCGFLFSPPIPPSTHTATQPRHTAMEPGRAGGSL